MELDLDTPHGPARVYLHPAEGDPVALLVLGHGANGQVRAPDLLKATEVANAEGVSVALVEQPYKVAGRRSAAPAPQLDAAWLAVLAHLRGGALAGLRVLTGGRSAGARVACRTAGETDAAAVLCLAFPVHPPGRPEKSRLPELDAVPMPVLVVQGSRDPFGMPPEAANRTVVTVAATHSLASAIPEVEAAVAAWLPGVLRS
jgi:predicted alpha/beta-hydrolase family hydrolase